MPLFSMEMDFKENSRYAYIKEKLKSIQQAVAKFGRLEKPWLRGTDL